MRNLKISIATFTIAFLIYFNYVLIKAFGFIGIAIGIIVIEIILMIFFILIKKHLDK